MEKEMIKVSKVEFEDMQAELAELRAYKANKVATQKRSQDKQKVKKDLAMKLYRQAVLDGKIKE